MSHKSATPEHQRPTLDKLHQQSAWNARLENQTYAVSGLWYTDTGFPPSEFKVRITGHADDVRETIEALKLDGNLHSLTATRIDTEETHS